MDFFAIFLTALTASFAWLYQKAWERQHHRVQRYQEIIDRLPAFTVGNTNATSINEAQQEFRRLWLFAPDNVVRAAHKFQMSTATGQKSSEEERAQLLGNLILEMRKDSSFSSSIAPRFFKTSLTDKDFLIITTSQKTLMTKAAD